MAVRTVEDRCDPRQGDMGDGAEPGFEEWAEQAVARIDRIMGQLQSLRAAIIAARPSGASPRH